VKNCSSIEWVLRDLYPGYSSWGMKLTTHLYLVAWLRWGAIPPLPHVLISWYLIKPRYKSTIFMLHSVAVFMYQTTLNNNQHILPICC